MKSNLLFPYYFKRLGWMLFLPGFILGYFAMFKQYNIPGFHISTLRPGNAGIYTTEFTRSLALALVIPGVMFIAFAKEKIEDELTAAIRRNALYWSILINYSMCIIAVIAAIIVGDVFYNINHILGSFGYLIGITSFNLFTTLVIFLARYYYLLHSKADEYRLGKLSFLPYKPYRIISTCTSIVLFVMFIFSKIFTLIGYSETILLLSISLLAWVFSRQKHEDEMVTSIRMESMQLALYFNYSVLLLGDLLIYGNSFFYFMMYNLFSVQIFFLIRFQFMYNKLTRELQEVQA